MVEMKAYLARLVYIWVYKDLAINRRGTRWKILKNGRAMDPIWGFCNWSAMKGTLLRSFLQYIKMLESELANDFFNFHAIVLCI